MASAQATRLSDWRFVCPVCGLCYDLNDLLEHWQRMRSDMAHLLLDDAKITAGQSGYSSAVIQFVLDHCNRISATAEPLRPLVAQKRKPKHE